MTGRVQTNRSPTTGNRPTGRQVGELYVNLADGQLGVINSGGTAQDLIGVTFFSPFSNYVTGNHVLQGGLLYRAMGTIAAGSFNPAQWQAISSTSGFLPLSGGTMTGTLTLASDPSGTNDAATKHYVDANVAGGVVTNPNRLINGDMRIAQINLSTGSTFAGGNTAMDRWLAISNLGGGSSPTIVGIQNGGSASLVPGFSNYLRGSNVNSVGYTPAAIDRWFIAQGLEGDSVSDFLWGTAGDFLPVTLSFWTRASAAGLYSGSIQNGAQTRSYGFSYTLSANTWQKFTITIPGDTGGTWVRSGTAVGLIVNFCFSSGATFLGPAGSTSGWVNGNYRGVTGSNPLVTPTSSGAWMDWTGIKLEAGNIATPFPKITVAEALRQCQRYLCKTYSQTEELAQNGTTSSALAVYVGPTADAASHLGVNWVFPVTMYAVPSVVLCSPSYSTFVGWGQAWAQNAGIVLTAGTGPISDGNAFLNLSGVSVAARDTILFQAMATAEVLILA